MKVSAGRGGCLYWRKKRRRGLSLLEEEEAVGKAIGKNHHNSNPRGQLARVSLLQGEALSNPLALLFSPCILHECLHRTIEAANCCYGLSDWRV